jgi:hypothetical protein
MTNVIPAVLRYDNGTRGKKFLQNKIKKRIVVKSRYEIA